MSWKIHSECAYLYLSDHKSVAVVDQCWYLDYTLSSTDDGKNFLMYIRKLKCMRKRQLTTNIECHCERARLGLMLARTTASLIFTHAEIKKDGPLHEESSFPAPYIV